MSIRFNPRLLLISVLLYSLQFCRAQTQTITVPGSISFDLGGSNAPANTSLWDLSGFYGLNLTIVGSHNIQVPLAFSFNMTQDGRGNLSGPTNDFQELDLDDNSFFAVTYRISGNVTGSGGIARARFTIRISGSGTLAGQTVNSFGAIITVDASTDPASGQLIGNKSSQFDATFGGLGGMHGVINDFATPLPAGVDGSWNLTMQLAGLNRITGSGGITTASKTIGLNLSGAFQDLATNPVFKIQARGLPNVVTGVGTTASIQITPDGSSISQFNGKLMGQRLSFMFSPD